MTREHLSPRLISWASILEDNTQAQAAPTATMPFIYPHLALMPDAHLGKGATVGSVIPTLGAIIPAAVGVDIGCGMIAVRTQFTADELPADGSLATLREAIERGRPAVGGQLQPQDRPRPPAPRVAELEALAETAGFDPAPYAANWRLQLGSLGLRQPLHRGDRRRDRTRVWLFLHSGSPRRRQQDRARSTSRSPQDAVRAVVDHAARPATWPTWSRAPTSSGATSASCGGRSSSRCSTARR